MKRYDRYQLSMLAKMWRRNLFGGKYEPVEKLMSDIPKERRKAADEGLEELHKDFLVIFHKGGDCASLNTSCKKELRKILEGELPDYILNLR